MQRFGSVLTFSTSLVGGILVGWFIHFPPTDSSSAAAWAQAIGAIAAIVGAVAVTRMQMRHTVDREELARRRDRDERLDGVVALATKLHLAVGRTQRTIKSRISLNTDYREAINGFVALSEGGINALGNIPLHEPPYAAVAREVIVIQRGLYLYKRRVSKLLHDGVDVGLQLTKAERILDLMGSEMQRLTDRTDRAKRSGAGAVAVEDA